MGRTRQTGNLTADALLVNDIANDLVKVGTGITFFGGAVGIVSALSFYGDGSNLSGVATGGGTLRRNNTYTANGVTTSFTVDDGYTTGYIDVYLNGSKLQKDAEFTADDGSTVVIEPAPDNGDIVDIVAFELNAPTNPNFRTTRSTSRIVAGAGQTTFSVSYTVGYVDVFFNGSKLDSTEFTASSGSDVILDSGADAGDVLEFVSYTSVSVNTLDVTVVNETTNATRNVVLTEATSGSISTVRTSSSNLTFNPSTGELTATTFTGNITGNVTGNVNGDLTGDVTGDVTGNVTGNLTGNADTATSTPTATNATNITVASQTSGTGYHILFVDNASGNEPPKTHSNTLKYDPATGTLYATKFSGDGQLLTAITATDVTLDCMLFGGI